MVQLGEGFKLAPLTPGEPMWHRQMSGSVAATLARMRRSAIGYDERAERLSTEAAEVLRNLKAGLAADITPVVELLRWVGANADSFLAEQIEGVLTLNERYRTVTGRYVRPGSVAAQK